MINSVSTVRNNKTSTQRFDRLKTPTSVLTDAAKSHQPMHGAPLFRQTGDQSRERFFSAQEKIAASVDDSNSQPSDNTTAALTKALQTRFAKSAGNPKQFHTLLKQALGENYNTDAAEAIRQQSLEGDFDWMPKLEVVEEQELSDSSGTQEAGAGLGAYSAETDTIYLSQQLVDGDFDQALTTLTEETGHALDARLNTNDATGDEGDIFARLLSGENIDSEQLLGLQNEDDNGSIFVDGREVEVEFSFIRKRANEAKKALDELKVKFSENVAQPIKQAAVRFGSWVGKNVGQPVRQGAERFGSWVGENVTQPIKAGAERLRSWVGENVAEPINAGAARLKSWLGENVAQPIKAGAERLGKWVGENVTQPIKQGTTRFTGLVNDNVLQPAKNTGNAVVRGAVSFADAVIAEPIRQGASIVNEYTVSIKQGAQSVFSQALDTFKDTSSDAASPVGLGRETDAGLAESNAAA